MAGFPFGRRSPFRGRGSFGRGLFLKRGGLDYLINYARDGTFTRASAATYWNPDTGLLTRYAVDELRVVDGAGSVYIEGARTNLFPYASDTTQWSGASTADSTREGPDGAAGSARQFLATAGSILDVLPAAGFTDNANIALSNFFVNDSRADQLFSLMRSKDSTASPSVLSDVDPAADKWGRQTNNNSRSMASGATDPYFRFYRGPDFVSTDEIGIYGVQAEENFFPSQLIETSGAAATRAVDLLTIDEADVDPRFLEGVWSIDVALGFDSSIAPVENLGSNYVFYWPAASGIGYLSVVDSGTVYTVRLRVGGLALTTPTITFTANTNINIKVEMGSGGAFLVVDHDGGTEIVNDTTTSAMSGITHVGKTDGDVSFFFGKIGRPVALDYVFDRPAELFAFADGAHTRASEATYFDPDTGLLTRYAVDEARILADGSYYCEGARTNVGTDSEGVGYFLGVTVTGSSVTGPDGSTLVSRVDFPAGVLARAGSKYQLNPIPQSVPVATTIMFKPISAIDDSEDIKVTTRNYSSVFNFADNFSTSGSIWEKRNVLFDSGITGATFLRSYVEKASTAFSYSAGVAGMQLEEGAFASQLIETSGAAVTRAADSMPIAQADVADWFFYKSWEIIVHPGWDSGINLATTQVVGTNAGGVGSNLITFTSTNHIGLWMGGVQMLAVINSGWSTSDEIRIRVNMTTGEFRIITPTQDIYSTHSSPSSWPSGDVDVGSRGSGVWPFFGKIFPPTPIDYVLDRPAELFAFADGTFTRSSEATYFDEDAGVLTRYAVDEARILADGSYYCEGARTNLETESSIIVLQSNGSVTSSVAINPDGVTVDADEFNASTTGTSTAGVLITHTTVSDSVDVVSSIFVKKVGPWESPFPAPQGRDKPGTFFNGDYYEDKLGWQRKGVVYDSGVGVVKMRSSYFQNPTTNPWAAYGWGGQLEEGSFITQLIETSGAAATRAVELMTIPQADVADWFWYKPIEYIVIPAFASTDTVAHGASQYVTSTAGLSLIAFLSTEGVVVAYTNSTKIQCNGCVWEAGDELIIRLDSNTGTLRVITPTTNIVTVNAAAIGNWAPTDVNIGMDSISNGQPFFGKIFPPTPIDSV